ncbi:uncharacterized protein ISCGN_002661 [Ixodes scapularis]
MPQRCSAVGCSNDSKPNRGLSFFRFPCASLHPTKRQFWIREIRRNNADGSPWQPSDYSRVCGNHFEQAVEQQETDTMAEVVDNSEDQCIQSTDTANDMCVAEDCDAATPLRDIHQRRLLEGRIVELERQLQAEKLRTQAQSQMIMKLEEKMPEIKRATDYGGRRK